MRIALLALLVAGCAARPVSGLTTIPRDTPATCENVCGNMGLKLGAVVVVSNEIGCVCEKGPSDHAAAGASAATLGVLIALKTTDVNREKAWAAGF